MKRMMALLLTLALPAALSACISPEDRRDTGGTDVPAPYEDAASADDTATAGLGGATALLSTGTSPNSTLKHTTIPTTTIAATTRAAAHTTAATQTEPTVSLPSLSTGLENRIKTDYLNLYFKEEYISQGRVTADDIKIRYYFGTYNDCVVMLIHGYAFSSGYAVSDEIANAGFDYKNIEYLDVWHDGRFYIVKTAYMEGLLAKADLEKINEIYKSVSPITDTAELSAEQEQTIKNDYRTWYERDDLTVQDIAIAHYFGTYNGCMVLWLDVNHTVYVARGRTEIIEGVEFTYSDGRGFDVWYNGAFYDLKSAHEKELLNKTDLEKISEIYHNKKESWKK